MASETIAQTNAAASGGAKPQPVAMEIPVTVNGASTVAGSDKRQPFSETTQTVLVFGSGAVIRLAAAVGPGQLLFVTNEKSKQEVVCQVVKTKQNGSATGYVELKFTEATADFWGICTLGNGATAPPSTLNGGPAAAPSHTLEQKLADLKTSTPAATQPDSAPVPPTIPVVTANVVAAAPIALAKEIQAAPVVPAQPPAPSKVPTLSEFLTHGSNGLELKARDTQPMQRSENREAQASVLIEEKPVGQAKPLQGSNQNDNKPSLSVALGVSTSPAPGSASFDLSADLPAEEVKIPAWLEPLARNSAIAEIKPAEPAATEVSNVELHAEEKAAVSTSVEVAEVYEAAPVLLAEGRAPNFGTSLPLGSEPERSGKGLKIALAVVALVLAAAAAWYWFVNQAPKVSAGGIGTVAENNPTSIPAPGANNGASDATSAATNSISSKTNLPTAAQPQPAAATTVASRLSSSAASANLAGANTTKSIVPSSSLVNSPEEEVAEPAKKPSLGQVRLAAPKVTRNEASAETGTVDPGLAMNGVTPADSSSLSLLTSKGKSPAAPLPVGGDVQVAKLISSVPPVYPQLARTQRVSGGVTIDALIDVNGRVSAVRVISGPALLHDAAMSAVKQWKYQAATLNGVPTATHLTVTVQFKLQ